MVFVDPPLGHIQYPMGKVSANALSYPERLRLVIFATQLFFPIRHPFDGFKLVPAHHAIPGVVTIGPYAALYPSARMLQMGILLLSGLPLTSLWPQPLQRAMHPLVRGSDVTTHVFISTTVELERLILIEKKGHGGRS